MDSVATVSAAIARLSLDRGCGVIGAHTLSPCLPFRSLWPSRALRLPFCVAGWSCFAPLTAFLDRPDRCFRAKDCAAGARSSLCCTSCFTAAWLGDARLPPELAATEPPASACSMETSSMPGYFLGATCLMQDCCRCALKPLLHCMLHCCLFWRCRTFLCTCSRDPGVSLQHAHP